MNMEPVTGAAPVNMGREASAQVSAGASSARLYAPSWLDQTTRWIRRLPMPAWLFYLLLILIFVFVETVPKWLDGTYPVGVLVPFHVVFAATFAFTLAAHRYLIDSVGTVKPAFYTVFDGDETKLESLLYQLTTSPARPTLLWSLGAAGIASLCWVVLGDSLPRYVLLSTSPLAATVDYLMMIVTWALIAATASYCVHLIQVLNYYLVRRANIDIFKLGSLYAFSGLTGRVAVIFLLGNYIWYLTDPAPPDLSVWRAWRLVTTLAVALIAVGAFLCPLIGVHHVLELQKRRLLEQNAQRVRVVMSRVYHLLDSGESGDLVALKNATDSLVAEQNTLEKLPTWPWHADTLRLVSTVLVLPLLAYLIERILAAVIGH
ncbi:MAG TPA: hypothetical protein VF276_16065 [Chloroflexia bacterium]